LQAPGWQAPRQPEHGDDAGGLHRQRQVAHGGTRSAGAGEHGNKMDDGAENQRHGADGEGDMKSRRWRHAAQRGGARREEGENGTDAEIDQHRRDPRFS